MELKSETDGSVGHVSAAPTGWHDRKQTRGDRRFEGEVPLAARVDVFYGELGDPRVG